MPQSLNAGLTVVHTRSARYGYASVRGDLARKANISEADDTYDIVPSLRPKKGEIVLDKWTFGAFDNTNLAEKLRRKGVRRLILAGNITNMSVMCTAFQAVDQMFR